MYRTVIKTIESKIPYSELTSTKQDALDNEYETVQRYLQGDDIEDLYSATQQTLDRQIEGEPDPTREYPWFIRVDTFDIEKRDTERYDWWMSVPVTEIYGGINVPIQPFQDFPKDSEFCGSKIVKRDGDYYAHITIEQEVEVENSFDDIIGVDFGVRWPAVSVALSDRDTKFYGEEIREKRRHYDELRTTLQKKGAYGTLKEIGSKEYRTVEDTLHKISRKIVDEAKERNALIVVGDLSGVSDKDLGPKSNNLLNSFPHYKLRNFIEYKAELAGLEMVEVNEYMTSQTCCRCGEQEDTMRQGQGRFMCVNCGLDDNADKNGATNIAKIGLGKDIQSPLSSLGGVCEPPHELSGVDEADADKSITVSLRADSETDSSSSH